MSRAQRRSRQKCLALGWVAAGLLSGCSEAPDTPIIRSSVKAAPAAAPVIFADRTQEAGLEFTHFNGMTGSFLLAEPLGAGVALFDMDRDGDLDAYLVQGRLLEPGKVVADALLEAPAAPLTDRLFRNEFVETGVLRFVDITQDSGIHSDGYGMGVAAGDYDGDGWVDLYVTNLGPNSLWRNLGGGSFEDVTQASGSDDPRWSAPAVFFDYNGDGALDLFVGNYVDFNLGTHTICSSESGRPDYCGPASYRAEPNRLFRNRGDGTFVDATVEAGLDDPFGPALGAIAADFDGDHRLDLYVANDGAANQMWMNQGARFENRALLGGTALSGEGIAEAGMGVDAGDYDNDGDLDLLVTHLMGETNTLYRNDGAGNFADASLVSGLGAPSLGVTGFGGGWLDFDNDGWLDVLVVNGSIRQLETIAMADEAYPLGQPNQLFWNSGQGTYKEVPGLGGPELATSEVSRGVAFGDVDNDGDLDVLIVNNSAAARLLLNVAVNEPAWFGARLVLEDGRREALGAVLHVRLADGTIVARRVARSKGYLSSSDPRVLVGLGDASSIRDAQVVWADGRRESFGSLPLRQYHVLLRGTGEERQ